MAVIPLERIQRTTYLLRGEKVMRDGDLATLYGVTTGNLNKAVKRNLQRFPTDFMEYQKDVAAVGIGLMPLLSTASRCSPACCAASAPSR